MRLTKAGSLGFPTQWIGFVLTVVIIVVGAGLGGMRGPEGGLAKVSDLLHDFEMGAFGEASNDRNAERRIEKWAYNVRVSLQGEVKRGDRKRIRSYLDEVEKFTGLRFLHIEEGHDDIDLEIRLISKQRMNQFAEEQYERNKHRWASKRSLGCFVISDKSYVRGYVSWARAILRDDLVSYCGQHEIMHVLGFRGHFWRTRPSVLSVGGHGDDLSINDKLLMRTLYDERMGPRMNRDAALAAAKRIIAELFGGVKRDGERSLHHPVYRHRIEEMSNGSISRRP